MCNGRGLQECYTGGGEYTPKVGEVCEIREAHVPGYYPWEPCTVLFIDNTSLVYSREGIATSFHCPVKRRDFRKIQSEEEKFCAALETLLSPSALKPYAIKDLSSCLYKHGFRYGGDDK